ncbi:CdaR family protein [Dehalobacter sp. DCM]|uniref:CdaR family protein n=1 Tax=Dehalobacter sp. DCM TaxID=2907827 RepID=UPI0030815F7A|nr:CdaR family protein [Dehalobacter sp. DCM]
MRELLALRDIIRRNMGYKIISIVLAVIFWASIVSTTNPSLLGQNSLPTQLVTKNQPSNLAIISSIPTITISLNDSAQTQNISEFEAYIDLKGATAGEHTYEVSIDSPDAKMIKNWSPKTVTLTLDSVKNKIVTVQPTIIGEPAEGYDVGTLILKPEVVNIRGPESILEKLDSVSVEVDLLGLSESKRISLPVKFSDSQKSISTSDPTLQSVKFYPDTIEVIIPIFEKGNASKMVPLHVDTKGTPAEGVEVRQIIPVPSQVKLIGPENALKGITFLNLGTIDIEGLSDSKEYDIALNSIALPSGVTFAAGTKISVMVTVAPKAVMQNIQVSVEVKNTGEGLTAEAITPITVTVSGYPDTLKTLKAADINAWVDAKGLKEGTYSDTTVLWELPSGVTMVNIPKVELVLKSVTANPQ